MKTIGLTILLQVISTLYAQDLRNTEWTKINAERKDGSKIVDHSGIDQGAVTYLFKEATVEILSGDQYSSEQPFSINDKKLTIGSFLRYHVDTVTNMLLVLTEMPSKQLTDDKINRLTFINSRFHLNYLIQKKQIAFLSDTLIQCNNQFSPIYNKGNLDELFMSQFQPIKVNTILKGNFILNPSGKVTNVQVMPSETFSRKEIDKFVEILDQTSGHWTLPKGRKSIHFKIDFMCQFMFKPPLSSIHFYFHSQDPQRFEKGGLTLKQKSEADQHFNKGIQLFYQDKYDKAIFEFSKCVSIDSLYLDAYYSKAYSYIKLGDKKSACEIWRQLNSMGQKLGEQLYSENCN